MGVGVSYFSSANARCSGAIKSSSSNGFNGLPSTDLRGIRIGPWAVSDEIDARYRATAAHSRMVYARARETSRQPLRCSLGHGISGRCQKSERRLTGNSGQTRKSQNSVRLPRRGRLSRAVNTTDGWQQKCAANVPTRIGRGYKRLQLYWTECSVRPENALRSRGERYLLDSGRIDRVPQQETLSLARV